MPIPRAQLETWAKPGALVSSQATYASIKAALATDKSKLKGAKIDVFLQGSYANHTNIYGDSDVDVVVRYEDTWGRDLTRLPQEQVQAYEQTYPKATYTWEQFRADTLASLRAYYGNAALNEGPKSLKLAAGPGRLSADIVSAITYKNFNYFVTPDIQSFVEGIRFHDTRDGAEIINYPKLHIENGERKNGRLRTNDNYKPTVRMFKNARTKLIDDNKIKKEVAPSYFVECLVYNVPDHLFVADRYEAMKGALQWLLDNPLPPMVSQNGIVPLFGVSRVQWTIANGQAFIDAVVGLWNNW